MKNHSHKISFCLLHNVQRRNVSCVPRNRWISTSCTQFAISKIHLKTHEQNYFSKCNQCHKLQKAVKNNWNKKVIP
jgi:cytochrome c2